MRPLKQGSLRIVYHPNLTFYFNANFIRGETNLTTLRHLKLNTVQEIIYLEKSLKKLQNQTRQRESLDQKFRPTS